MWGEARGSRREEGMRGEARGSRREEEIEFRVGDLVNERVSSFFVQHAYHADHDQEGCGISSSKLAPRCSHLPFPAPRWLCASFFGVVSGGCFSARRFCATIAERSLTLVAHGECLMGQWASGAASVWLLAAREANRETVKLTRWNRCHPFKSLENQSPQRPSTWHRSERTPEEVLRRCSTSLLISTGPFRLDRPPVYAGSRRPLAARSPLIRSLP